MILVGFYLIGDGWWSFLGAYLDDVRAVLCHRFKETILKSLIFLFGIFDRVIFALGFEQVTAPN